MLRLMDKLKLQYKIMALVFGMMCVVLAVTGAFILEGIEEYVTKTVTERALTIARTAANIPLAQTAIVSDKPSALLQPVAERLRLSTGAAFVIYSNMQQIRLTYPVLSEVGKPMSNLYREPVLHGEEYVYVAKGDLSPTLRANVPVFEQTTGRQIGFVSVGIYLDDIREITRKNLQQLGYVFLLALVLSVIGAWWLAKHIKKTIFGLEPYEIATLLKERIATLEAIHEGVLGVDSNKQIRICNNEAASILGIAAESAEGKLIDSILPKNRLTDVIASGHAIYNEVQNVGEIIIMANSVPVIVDQKVVGAVISFRDRTEINQMAEELTGIHRFVDGLRAQTHEFKNKLHTVAGLIQLEQYEEAIDYAIDSQIQVQSQLNQLSRSITDQIICGLLLGKASQMKEAGIDFAIDPESQLLNLPVNVTSGDMVLIIGNVLQNAVDAVSLVEDKSIWLQIRQQPDVLTVTVRNSGPHIAENLTNRMYQRGVTTKAQGGGLGLALLREKLQLFHGTVKHCNLPNGGVEFEVTIPY